MRASSVILATFVLVVCFLCSAPCAASATEAVDSNHINISLLVVTPTPVALIRGINSSLDVQLNLPISSSGTVCVTKIIEANQLVFVQMAAGDAVMSRMTLILGSRRNSSPVQIYQGSCVDTVEMLHAMQIWGGELGLHWLIVTVNASTNASAAIQIPVSISTRAPPPRSPPDEPFDFEPIIKYGGVALGAVVGLIAFIYLGCWVRAWLRTPPVTKPHLPHTATDTNTAPNRVKEEQSTVPSSGTTLESQPSSNSLGLAAELYSVVVQADLAQNQSQTPAS